MPSWDKRLPIGRRYITQQKTQDAVTVETKLINSNL